MRNKVRQILEKAGHTGYEAAPLLGVSLNTVYSWLKDDAKIPGPKALDAFWRVYGAQPNDCLEND